ncbi:MAG: site-specific integrase [Candidatus Schekmanbacteria bacterium]|nr:site-specific integrase [Candidatus Schekmanbacteria bacterium]
MFKRKGVWWTCIRHEGRKLQKSLETSDKKLATSIEAKIRTEIIEGKYFDKPKEEVVVTVNELIEKYLSEHSLPNKAPKTYYDDSCFSKQIKQHFGKMLLTKVSPKHIAAFIKKRRDDGVKDVTINHELRVLRHAYNLAIKYWELVDETPFAKISIPRGDVKRVRYLSEDEEQRLFKNLPDWLEPVVIIARETGLRLSNVANLKWSQVNLFNKMIIIEKTKNGDPIGLPMTDRVYDTLRVLNKVRQIGMGNVFTLNGKPLLSKWISASFRRVCQKAGVENFRFHDLRHDFCSRLVQRGVDLYTVATLAGHKDVQMTQRYAHLSPEKLRAAMNALNSDYILTTPGQKAKSVVL